MISQTILNDYEREAQLRRRAGEATLTVSCEDLLALLDEIKAACHLARTAIETG